MESQQNISVISREWKGNKFLNNFIKGKAMYRLIPFVIFLIPVLFAGCKEDSNPIFPNKLNFNDQINYDNLQSGIIAFERINADGSAQGICFINASNRNTNVLSGLMGGPEISPDGSKIIYSSLIDYHTLYDIYLINTNGGSLKNVSGLAGNDAYASWSPDSKNILFLNYYGFPDLYIVNINNLSDKTLLYNSDTFAANTPCSYYDSRNIVFSDGVEIKLLNSVDKTITTLCSPQIGGTYTPRWSHDGKKILFVVAKFIDINNCSYNAGGFIQYFNIETSQTSTVYEWQCNGHDTWAGQNELSACWSPDDSKILFNKTGDGFESHLYIINVDGTGLKQITSELGVSDRSVSWSSQ
jgi:Tol biopolymer transport system component